MAKGNDKTYYNALMILCVVLIASIMAYKGYLIQKRNSGNPGNIEECTSCFNSKEYQKAYESCSKLSFKGNIFAKVTLGRMYEDGLYVQKDYGKAEKLYTEVADFRSNPEGKMIGQYCLGDLYKRKDFKKSDLEVSAKWYRSSADLGYKNAQLQYGLLLLLGKGTQQNIGLSKVYLKKASENGMRDADKILAMLNGPDADKAVAQLIEKEKQSQ